MSEDRRRIKAAYKKKARSKIKTASSQIKKTAKKKTVKKNTATAMNSTSAAARMTQLHRFLLHHAPAVSRSAFRSFRFMGVSSINGIWLQHSNFRPRCQ